MPGGSGQNFSPSTCPTKYATQIRFNILKAEDIKELAVVEITEDQIIDRYGGVKWGGINDPRMGTMDIDTECETCKCNYSDCPGHFGRITMPIPIYHPGYVTTTLKILKCICYHCGRLKLRDRDLREEIRTKAGPRKRFKKTFDACSKLEMCQDKDNDGCGHIQPKYSREGLTIFQTFKVRQTGVYGQNDTKLQYTADEALKIFKKIPEEELRFLGMDAKNARPEWMIIQQLAVAPPPVRPSVDNGGGTRSHDDLTQAYLQVIRKSKELQGLMDSGQTGNYKLDCLNNLQVLVATLMDNNSPDVLVQRLKQGRPIKCIRSRLKGKEGRVRGNLMGKRVDYSARSVITPDPILQLDQLGVPQLIATNLTRPEHVTEQNKNDMKKLVENGPNQWPGAKFIIRLDGKQIDLANKRCRNDEHLDVGYIVERHLRDNDFVVFNRQPSLHKMSMMGHRVKVLPYQTFRLNLSVTSPYNADFDGDEMNMHVPQSYETMAEIKEIMHVPKQVVAPKNNAPVMGIVQDSLLGISQLTLRDTFIELDQMMNLMMWVNYDGKLPPPAIIKPRPLWTGKQLISLVIPDINFVNKGDKSGWCSYKDKNVMVKNGELVCGIMNKGVVGARGGGLVHLAWRDISPEACKIFLSDTQNIVNNWLVQYGFSVGVQDIVPDRNTEREIGDVLEKYKRKVQRIVQKTQRGQLKTLPGKAMFDSFEVEVNSILNKARETSGSMALEALPSFNRLFNMVDSGSKGSSLNISQIMACCGQQNVEGKRIPFGFNRRSLPHYSKDDYGPDSKGFVTSCFFGGLTPQEFYFHAMGGREGIIDTACKTAETGYIQRRLIKALEDVQVKYDQTVRTAKDQVLQFIYGEDGMDAHYIENMSIPLLKMDNKSMDKEFKIFKPEHDQMERRQVLKQFIHEEIVDGIPDRDLTETSKMLVEEFNQLWKDREALRKDIIKTGEDKIHLPIHVPRLIQIAKEKHEVKAHGKSDLTPAMVIDSVRDLYENGLRVYQQPRLASSKILSEANENATWLAKIYLRSCLTVKHVIQRERMSKKSFNWLCGEIKDRYERSIVNPGEMVGCIGAQSMGEPATQMTLNTFHMAGVASKNVTLGVPRLREVINVAKNIKTPSLRIFLEEQYRKDEEKIREVGNQIEYTNLSHVVKTSAIFYDPDPKKTVIEADQELLDTFLDTVLDEELYRQKTSQLSPWLMRLELDKNKIISKDVSMEMIEDCIKQGLGGDETCEIIKNQDHEDLKDLVLRLRLLNFANEEDKTVPMLLKEGESTLLNKLTLKGIQQITKVSYSKEAAQCKLDVFDPVTGAYSKDQGNIIIETDGVALKEVLGIEHIDTCLTTSNDVVEILKTLGIEATRQSLIAELRFVLNSYGIYVNYRHLSTLCDIMTTRGSLTPITRHGINRVDSGPLRKCSFEETVEILLDASLHAEVDPLLGVTENIIMGQLAPYGTGCFDLMMDCAELMDCTQLNNNHQVESPASEPPTPIPGPSPTPMPCPSPAYDNFHDSPITSPFQMDQNQHGGPVRSPGYDSQWQANPPTSPPIFINGGQSTHQQPRGYNAGQGGYSPTMQSPSYNPGRFAGASPGYSPQQQTRGGMASPQYRPTAGGGMASPGYRPMASPGYRPMASPQYRPTTAGMASPQYRPTTAGMASPQYRPTNAGMASPQYGGYMGSPSYQANAGFPGPTPQGGFNNPNAPRGNSQQTPPGPGGFNNPNNPRGNNNQY